MEQLIKELKTKISLLKKNGENRYNLMDIGFFCHIQNTKNISRLDFKKSYK